MCFKRAFTFVSLNTSAVLQALVLIKHGVLKRSISCRENIFTFHVVRKVMVCMLCFTLPSLAPLIRQNMGSLLIIFNDISLSWWAQDVVNFTSTGDTVQIFTFWVLFCSLENLPVLHWISVLMDFTSKMCRKSCSLLLPPARGLLLKGLKKCLWFI